MRVPLSWLKRYCDPGMSAEELAERLALTGTEVERVTRFGSGADEGFVIGRVVTADPHPNADRLKVCTVDLGEHEPVTIVCGAPNVAAGQTVAVARPGAVMPDGGKLGKAKLRGVESSGMILAEDELEIGSDHSGVIVLDDPSAGLPAAETASPGAPLATLLPPGDDVLELEVTPNRPDCLGVYGVARELHAITGAPLLALDELEPGDIEPAGDEDFPIDVRDPELCPRFTARLFDDVKVGPSPLWLKQRLAAAGQRPINNVVDITNYVMLLTGQPMHAFDRDRIRGGRLIVRRAAEGETMTTLDGVERELDTETMLVCDAEGPSGIAGIMGGQVSEVSNTTTRVLLEVATWNGPNIHRTSQRLGLRSEAGTRFEKGLSMRSPIEAQAVAGRLLVELCGARLVSSTIDVAVPEPATPAIPLRAERITALLGAAIPLAECRAILERLGFAVSEGPDVGALSVTPPHFRSNDVTREADLIEEVARVHGIDSLPTTLPAAAAVGRLTASQRLRRRIEDLCADRGFSEAITWSFIGATDLERLQAASQNGSDALPARRIANPLSEDQSLMRPLLLPGLLAAVRHNINHGSGSARLFEIGRSYAAEPAGDERNVLAAVACGSARARGWRGEPAPRSDFFTMKALLDAISQVARVQLRLSAAADGGETFLHPGRRAAILVGDGGRPAGYIGELHPLVATAHGIEAATAFECDLDLLAAELSGPALYREISSFPPVREDIAVVVDAEITAARVLAAVRAAAGDLLASARLFDVYSGDQIEAGNVSLAIALEFGARDRTLTDDDVAALRGSIASGLAEIGASLRV